MSDKKTYKPGMIVPISGQYEVIGPRGGRTGIEVTSVKNEPFPPTPNPGCKYVLADETKLRK